MEIDQTPSVHSFCGMCVTSNHYNHNACDKTLAIDQYEIINFKTSDEKKGGLIDCTVSYVIIDHIIMLNFERVHQTCTTNLFVWCVSVVFKQGVVCVVCVCGVHEAFCVM